MSPSSREINGSRPALLKIHRDSHLIHKASSSASSSSSTPAAAAASSQRHHPVIIYTHSPKVIHTNARDFMTLVQKLTGLTRSAADVVVDGRSSSSLPPAPTPLNNASGRKLYNKDNINNKAAAAAAVAASASDDSSSTSSENCSFGAGDSQVRCSSLTAAGAVSPIAFEPLPPPNPFLSELPLFTPNSSDLFCSQRSFYRFPDSSLFSPFINPSVTTTAISPSVMDAIINTYHDY